MFCSTSGAVGGVWSSGSVTVPSLVLPNGSVTVIEPTSPGCSGFGSNDQLPSWSMTVVTVLPSGRSTVTVPPGTPVPLRALPLFWSTAGGAGRSDSIIPVSTPALELPAASLTMIDPLTPGVRGFGTILHCPSGPTVAVNVLPSSRLMIMVLPGSAVPAKPSMLFRVTSATAGAVTSATPVLIEPLCMPFKLACREPCSPSANGLGLKCHRPLSSANAVTTVPSAKVRETVAPGLDLPVRPCMLLNSTVGTEGLVRPGLALTESEPLPSPSP
ncbi:hypothetical protein D3C80_1142170 [compost metagenome]